MDEPSQQPKTQESNDVESLYLGLIAGDGEAWGVFYDSYAGKLDCFFYDQGLFDEKQREEAFQETMLEVFNHLGRYNPETKQFNGWVYGVARNVALRSKKQYAIKTGNEESNEEAVDRSAYSTFITSDGSKPIARALPLPPDLRLAIEALSRKEREVLEIRLSRSPAVWTWKEIAQELGRGESATKMSYHRAISKLRSALDGDGPSYSETE